jgi:hypothetical protein
MAGTRAKALAKTSSLWVLEATLSCSSVCQSDCSWFRPSSFRGHVWREVWGHDEGGQRQDVSGRKESLRSILTCIPETALLTFCTGTGLLPPGVLIDAAKLCWQHRQNMEAGRWPKEALRFSFEGSRGVGRPKVGTDWCGNVKSITEQIQHTLNIAKVTAQAGSTSLA